MFARTLLVISAALAFSACATKAPAAFSPGNACSVSASTYDSREVKCQFPKSESGHSFRFKANFSGGHDDTVARLEPSINNAPLSCAEGSKTHLSAEDGEVSLWCDFSITTPNNADSVLNVLIRWSHADYMNYELTAN